jgi:hypothetical protein
MLAYSRTTGAKEICVQEMNIQCYSESVLFVFKISNGSILLYKVVLNYFDSLIDFPFVLKRLLLPFKFFKSYESWKEVSLLRRDTDLGGAEHD